MGLKIWYYKKFRKDEVVKLYFTTATNRLRVIYKIAKGKQIKIDNQRFELNDEDYVIQKGLPTFFLVEGRIEPINVHDLKKSTMSPEYYDTAISANLATELFNAGGSKVDIQQIMLIVIFGTLIASVVGNYLLYESIQTLLAENQILNDMLRSLGARP